MSNRSDIRSVHLKDFEPVQPDLLKVLPEGLVRRKLIIPIGKRDGRLIAAVSKTEGSITADGLKIFAGCPVEVVLAPLEEIIDFIRKHYTGDGLEIVPILEDPELPVAEKPAPALVSTAQSVVVPSAPPLPLDLEKLLADGAINRASEILIERDGAKVRVRQRIRGVLVSELKAIPNLEATQKIFDLVTKRGEIKSSEGVSWAEWRTEYVHKNERYLCDLVLSETPSFGLLTIQFIRSEVKAFTPESWGMGPNQSKVLDQLLHKSQGVILFCGPESEDLTRNLHACAKELATSEKHLIAVESAMEEWLPSLEQLVSKGDPQFFSNLLRVAFRHAPDIVLVNPMEKREHIELCLIEALKGRLIMGRAFALDSAHAFLQFLAMGIEPYLVGSSLLGVVAQRSLRLVCPRCQEKEPINREILKELNIPLAMQPTSFYRGKGCDHCMGTGYDRETNIFEVLEITPEMRAKLSRQMSLDDIKSIFKANGMMTLRQVALHKAINGQTSLSEVLRVTS